MDGTFVAVGSHKGRLYIYDINERRVSVTFHYSYTLSKIILRVKYV